MSDDRKTPTGMPPGAIHLGTVSLKGPGTFVSGVVKLSGDSANDLLASAQSFLKAADRCLTGLKLQPDVEMLTVPGAVCAAFACELYLKYIHLKKSGAAPHGHDLAALFSHLGESLRAKLLACRADIEEVLERNRRHFMDARYHHELAQLSFRQGELLQVAEAFAVYVRDRYGPRV
jgi:HEPN domain-containing protein